MIKGIIIFYYKMQNNFLLEGKGVFHIDNAGTFEGEIFNGEKGSGIVYLNDSIYHGDIIKYKIEGNGTQVYQNSEKYIGEFKGILNLRKDNKENGYGEYYFNNGDVYKGNWLNDKKNSNGKFFFNNGDIYEGEFEIDKL